MKRIFLAIVAALLLALSVSGCSTVSTEPDQMALHYAGGPMSSKEFQACVNPSTRKMGGVGERYYIYPTSQRTYDASTSPGAESPPVVIVSKDNAELNVPVSVTFTLRTDCETLRKFHESVGNRYRAYWQGSEGFSDEADDKNKDSIPDGWVQLLNFYFGKSLDTTLDRAAQAYNWRDLWNDSAVKAKLEKAVEENLTASIQDRLNGDYFVISTILLQKPDPVNVDLKAAVVAEQAAVAKARAAEAEAKARETSAVAQQRALQAEAEAKILVARAEAAQISEQLRVLGEDVWLKKYGIDKGITPWPNPVVPGANATIK